MFYIIFCIIFACTDYTVQAVEKRQPSILVHPTHINFGHLHSGYQTETETFTIINTGDEDLIIYKPDLVSGNTRYSVSFYEDEYVISAGQLIDFEITYSPKTFESNGAYIDILSNDEDNPHSRVTLEGYGDAPVMVVTPTDFDYGDISIGCDNEERITIRNEGNLDLEITSLTQMVTQPVDIIMEMGSLPDLPWTLPPSQEIDFLVSYIPTDVGSDESQIVIEGTDPSTPETVTTQFGTGDVEHWYTQQWQQEEIPVLDILWVIDNSGSMNPFQQSLSNNTSHFMSVFSSTGADYNMAVITTDRYLFSTIITTTTSSPELVLSSLILTGISGSGNEKGIEMAKRSLTSPSAAGPGGSFFREHSKLIVIFVSDEPDHSQYGWQSYLSFFDTIKPPGDFVPYAIIGDIPGGCQIQHGNNLRNAQEGWGYWDIVNNYGGSWYSICSTDWGLQLQDLADEVMGRKVFFLDEQDPIDATITVYVNGQETLDWSYDLSLNAVVFNDDSIPTEGQTISIDYATWGCDGS